MNDKARIQLMQWLGETEKGLQAFYRLLDTDRAEVLGVKREMENLREICRIAETLEETKDGGGKNAPK